MHQVGEHRADLIDTLTQLAHIAPWHWRVQVADLRVGVGGEDAILALGAGMGFLAGVGAQVQRVDFDLLAQRRLAHFGFVHLGGGERVVLAQRAGIGDQQDDAPAVAGPIHAVHRLHHPGKRIFVERVAGHRRRFDLARHIQKALRIAALVEGNEGLGDILKARGFLDAAAKADHAEADAVQFATLGNAGLQLVHHVANLVNVGLHRHSGVHHQHHRRAERIGMGAERRAGRFGSGAAAWVDGGHVEQLHRLAVVVEAFFGVENRQQVELVLRHRAGGGFQGQDLLVVLTVALRLGQHAFRSGRVGQQFFHLCGLAQEHYGRPPRALGELEHQALFPVADLGGWQPTVAATIGGGADAYPRAAVDVFALVHVEHGKRRQRFTRRAPCVR